MLKGNFNLIIRITHSGHKVVVDVAFVLDSVWVIVHVSFNGMAEFSL